MNTTSELGQPDFLAGGGEMGKLVASMDWSETSLGPIESWPQSLRTTVSLCLCSNFPISLAWGPKHVQIYNDGYWPICGGKHPHSMGQDYSECWASAWPAIGEAFDRGLAGEASYIENRRMFLDRYGYLEETFFTFSFSPIRDESGNVGGLFHPVTEETGKMLSERRTRALRDLSARTNKAKSIADVLSTAAQTLAEHDLDLPFVLFYSLEADGTQAELVAHAGCVPGTPATPIRVDLATAPSSFWPLREAAATGKMIQVDELEQRFGSLSCGPYPESPKTAFVAPIFLPGSSQTAAIVVAGASSRLPLNEVYRDFFDLTVATLSAAVANARAYDDERRRAEALAELDRAKTAFFSNISHEFRTPLSLILGPVEEALNDAATPLTVAQRARVDIIQHNALRLLKLVNALLDFSRMEAGRMQASFAPVDLAVLTAGLASSFRSLCEKGSLRLVVDCPALPATYYVDTEMWEKIVLNLISNAFKFTLSGTISVSLRPVQGGVELAVRDTGTGIPKHELPHLFERFHRIEGARGRSYEGSGIGLALVWDLVKLHNGNLDVESEVDQGSVFRVFLRAGSAHLPAEQIGTLRTGAASPIRADAFVEDALRWLPDPSNIESTHEVLDRVTGDAGLMGDPGTTDALLPRIVVADDSTEMRAYVTRILRARGYGVLAVPDAEQALLACGAEPVPDLIIADVLMPGLGGFGLLQAVRSDPALEGLLVILLSARAGEEARVEGLMSGADDYLIKPFSARELVARVDGSVKLARLRRQAAERERRLETELIAERGRVALSESEASRRVSEEKYRLLLNQAPEAILVLDADGFVLEANRGAEAMFDHPHHRIVGHALGSFLAPTQLEELRKLLVDDSVAGTELTLPRDEGGERRFEISRTRVGLAGGAITLLVARDITDRILLKKELRQSRKAAAIGQLAGDIRPTAREAERDREVRQFFETPATANVVKYAAGQTVFNQGDKAFSLCYLVQGRAKLTADSAAGREAVIHIVRAGELLGADCLCPQKIRIATAIAMDECVVMHKPTAEVVRAIEMNAAFAAGLTAWLASRARRLEEDVIEHIVSSSEQRLARLLLLMAKIEHGIPSSAVIEKITQETLGHMIGTTRSRVNAFMQRFCDLGYVSYEDGIIRIHSSLHNILIDEP